MIGKLTGPKGGAEIGDFVFPLLLNGLMLLKKERS